MKAVNNDSFDNSWFNPGRGRFIQLIWYIVNAVLFNSYLFPFSYLKKIILNLFGARIGIGEVIKPKVSIKYPWKLSVGDYSWIGENVWIDNLASVSIGATCCLSQGAMLLTGNHNYKKTTFDLMIDEIILENGVWIGSQSTVCPKVTCKSHSILSVGSVATSNLEPYSVYQGNPAVFIKLRVIE